MIDLATIFLLEDLMGDLDGGDLYTIDLLVEAFGEEVLEQLRDMDYLDRMDFIDSLFD
jgi:hypothetical protein